MAVNDRISKLLSSYGSAINEKVYYWLGSLGYINSLSDSLSKYSYNGKRGWLAIIAEARNTLANSQTLVLDSVNKRFYVDEGESTTYSDDLEDALTFTRASTATYFDAQGVLQTAAVDEPRFDHDPVTGEPLGIMVEGSGTNLLLWSEDCSGASWSIAFASRNRVSASNPMDASLVNKIIPTETSTLFHRLTQSQTLSGGADHTLSFFVSSAGYDYAVARLSGEFLTGTFYIGLDLAAGIATDVDGIGTEIRMEALGGGWFRVSIPFTTDQAGTGDAVYIIPRPDNSWKTAFAGDGTSGIYIWGAQLEASPAPTSYIPTSGSPVTRAEDNVSRVLGSEFNASEGTVLVEVHDESTQGRATYFGTAETTLGDAFGIGRIGGNIHCSVFDVEGAPNNLVLPSPVGRFKTAMSFSKPSADLTFSVNGVSVSSSPSNYLDPEVLRILARWASATGPGFRIERIEFIPRALSAAELEALTAL